MTKVEYYITKQYIPGICEPAVELVGRLGKALPQHIIIFLAILFSSQFFITLLYIWDRKIFVPIKTSRDPTYHCYVYIMKYWIGSGNPGHNELDSTQVIFRSSVAFQWINKNENGNQSLCICPIRAGFLNEDSKQKPSSYLGNH